MLKSCRMFGLILIGLLMAMPAMAGNQKGFVKIAEGRELYIDYIEPAPGKPIAVLLNGLTYSTRQWDAFTHELEGNGLGILRYDPMAMGQTLLKYGAPIAPVQYRDQIADLQALLNTLGITQPVHVVGLSYGGALALQFGHEHPDRVASLIIMAPFIAPLEQQDNWIRLQVQQTRLLYPWNDATYDDLYDYFLKINIFTTYPMVEPIVLENAYKLEATFRMVQGIRRFVAKDISKFQPNVSVHLVVGKQDQYIDNKIHEDFWKLLQPGTQASFMYMRLTDHKIPESSPRFAALWVRAIIEGNPNIGGGRIYTGNPYSGEVTSDKSSFVLK
jgi:pimeloyl-ACP methyl ester carboxylesterase